MILSREAKEFTLLFSIRLSSLVSLGSLKFTTLSFTIFNQHFLLWTTSSREWEGGKEEVVHYVATVRLKLNYLKSALKAVNAPSFV